MTGRAQFGIATPPQQVAYGELVLSLPAPYRDGIAHWFADEVITPSLEN